MTDSEPPRRRPRYPGKNPRKFSEKYKEHQPERFADEIAKVLASGRTPVGTHRPILVREVLDALGPKPGELAVDCTLGHGGHAQAILDALHPGGRLIAIDSDPIERPRAEARLRGLGFPDDSLVVRAGNFASLRSILEVEAPGGADCLLADLGLSSMQIDDPERGFTFKADGPLDMRIDPTQDRTAAELLASIDRPSLAKILEENADEPDADPLARAIWIAQRRSPLTTTGSLARALREAGATDDAIRRIFQAIRIEVNHEFPSLDQLLEALPACLKPGARVAILTFHSGEDRRVKAAFKEGSRDGTYATVARQVIRASPEERHSNPRSTSAKLRTATRSRS